MKLTAEEVYNAVGALKKLADEKLPVKGAYWLSRLATKLDPEYQAIDKQRNALVKKYGEEADGQIRVVNGNLALFANEFNEVLKQEIEVDCPMIKLELLGNGDIPGGVLLPLDKFIDAEA